MKPRWKTDLHHHLKLPRRSEKGHEVSQRDDTVQSSNESSKQIREAGFTLIASQFKLFLLHTHVVSAGSHLHSLNRHFGHTLVIGRGLRQRFDYKTTTTTTKNRQRND